MAQDLSLASIAQRNQEIVDAGIDGETVMMSIATGQYYGLDTIASDIWNMLEKPTKVQTICQQLLEDYDVDSQQCHKDVLAFLNSLKDNNIIEVQA